jgi:hypothetical protein
MPFISITLAYTLGAVLTTQSLCAQRRRVAGTPRILRGMMRA